LLVDGDEQRGYTVKLAIQIVLNAALGLSAAGQAVTNTAGGAASVAEQANKRSVAVESDAAAKTQEARRVASEAESNPDLQRQKQQFEAALRAIESDQNYREQRDRMNRERLLWESTPEIQLQKSRMEIDLRLTEQAADWQEKVRKLQNDLDQARHVGNSPQLNRK
jgi:hypothetical protein